jgi:hypothetical protein
MPQPLSTDEMLAHRRAISPVDGCAGLHRAEEGCRVALLDPGLAQTARAWPARTSAWSQSLRAIASSARSHRPVEFGYRIQVADNDGWHRSQLQRRIQRSAGRPAAGAGGGTNRPVHRPRPARGHRRPAATASPRWSATCKPLACAPSRSAKPRPHQSGKRPSISAASVGWSNGAPAPKGGISYLKRGYGWDRTRLDAGIPVPLRQVLSTGYSPNTCSIALMAVQRPNWWCYPERCANGHEWGPGLITVSWMPCECGPAAAAREHGPGHVVVYCEAVKGCRSAWYQPPHDPER